MLRRASALIAALLLLTGADEPQLVPDVSQREVQILYSFTGADLLLFGAIVYPGGVRPDKPADIVVVLKGPEQSIQMREKQKVAGIWVNADSARFESAPSFYAMASSRPISQIVDERTAAIYELGVDKLQLSPSSLNDSAELNRFQAGLVDLRDRAGLFVERQGTVEITDGVLYRARCLPASSSATIRPKPFWCRMAASSPPPCATSLCANRASNSSWRSLLKTGRSSMV